MNFATMPYTYDDNLIVVLKSIAEHIGAGTKGYDEFPTMGVVSYVSS